MQRSRECAECGEVHLLRSDGRMSIHQTERGERCEEREARPAQGARSRGYRGGAALSERDELQEALDYAAAHGGRNKRRDDRPDPGMDRRIYATGGVKVVRGGAPGLKRRK